MLYRAVAGVGTSKRLILKGETISEKEYNGLSDRHKNKFVVVKAAETKEPPNRNESEEAKSDESSDADKNKTKEPPKRKR